jgi:cysteine desulfurase
MKPIYLDSNATTPLSPAVWERMQPFFFDYFGNPASSHSAGRRARQGLEESRELTAALLGADPDEVIFTSGATEANNLALFGLAGKSPGPLLLGPVEHPCVLEPARQLGFPLLFLDVDSTGKVILDSLPANLSADTRLAAVMLANHETGTVQPVQELRQHLPPTIPFHCDAAAAAGKMPIHFHDLGVTSLTLSAHKFHGPKGVGVLLIRRNSKFHPYLFGGHQQRGLRPGTEPVPLAVGLAAALQSAVEQMAQRQRIVHQLRSHFWQALQAAAPVVWNGSEEGLPYTLNVSFPGCRSDVLLMNLDLAGIACSTGSACSSGSLLPSPVLNAMRVPPEVLHSAMRFSFSPLLTVADMEEAGTRIATVVERLRFSEPLAV